MTGWVSACVLHYLVKVLKNPYLHWEMCVDVTIGERVVRLNMENVGDERMGHVLCMDAVNKQIGAEWFGDFYEF